MKLIMDDGTEFQFEKVFLVEMQPGDTLIINHPQTLSHTTIENIRQIFMERYNIPVAVLSEGMTPACVIRKAMP